jgi:hypothetical protein
MSGWKRNAARNAEIVVMAAAGCTHAQIGKHFGIPRDTVSAIVSRARKQMPVPAPREPKPKIAKPKEEPNKPAPVPYVGIVVPARTPAEFRPLSLSTTLQLNGARAAELYDKPFISIASSAAREDAA